MSTAERHEPAQPPVADPRALRARVVRAVLTVGGRDSAVKALALLGNIGFARLLSPAAFGEVAFGLAVVLFAQLLSDGGLGVGLIRRPEKPEDDDLRVLLGYQLLLTCLLGAVVASVGIELGRPGQVTALMMVALPFLAVRAPSAIVFERSLEFAPLVKAEVGEQVAYYGIGFALLLAGAGVWGLAIASVVKAAVGAIAVLRVSPVAGLRPLWSWRRLRAMLGFGVRFQAVQVINSARMQLLNIGVAAISGLWSVGMWAMAWRVAQIPFLLFGVLWRVSYPGVAQLLSAGESARNLVERGVSIAAVATGAVLAPATAALAPLVPLLFGERWHGVAYMLPVAFFALQASGPVSVATAGYLYAVGDTAVVLRATAVASAIWLVVAFGLLHVVGVIAISIGWAAGSIAEIPMLCWPVRRRTGAKLLGHLAVPWLVACLAAGAGWYVAAVLGTNVQSAIAGSSVAMCGYWLVMLAWRRNDVVRLTSLVGRMRRVEVSSE